MKRPKKILKWTAVVLGLLVAIGLVANAVFVWITDARLERQLAEIRAAGDPLTLADLARPPIPAEQNAATYLRQARADAEAIDSILYNKDYREGWGKQWDAERRLPPEGAKAIQAALAAYSNVVPLLGQAAACPDYDADLDYSLASDEFIANLTDRMRECRAAARVLRYQAALLLSEGKPDESVQTSLLIFRLARNFDRNPTIVGYCVAIAIRGSAVRAANEALQAGPLSKEIRDALDAELAMQERMQGLYHAMRTDRPFAIGYIQNLPGRNCWFIGRGVWNMQESEYLDLFATFIVQARDPGPYREIEQTIESQKSALAAMVLPGLKAAFSAVVRMRAEIRCLRVLNALQTHTPPETTEVPKLTDLGLPAETITDPFTGEPLHVKRFAQGWLVYSVGSNLQDDGGKLDDNSDVGVGPPLPAGNP